MPAGSVWPFCSATAVFLLLWQRLFQFLRQREEQAGQVLDQRADAGVVKGQRGGKWVLRAELVLESVT